MQPYESTDMEVNPVMFGKMQVQIASLQAEVEMLRRDVKTLVELANKGRGAFWFAMLAAGALGWLASIVPWPHLGK